MLQLTYLLSLWKIRKALPHCPWLQGPVPVLYGLYLYLNLQIHLEKQLITLRFNLTETIIKKQAIACLWNQWEPFNYLSNLQCILVCTLSLRKNNAESAGVTMMAYFPAERLFIQKEKGDLVCMRHWGPCSAVIRWKQKCSKWTWTNEPKWSCIINPEGESHALKRKWVWMLVDRPRSAVTRQGAAVRMWVEELASLRDNSEKEDETTSSSFSSPPPPLPPPPPHPLSTLHSHSGR